MGRYMGRARLIESGQKSPGIDFDKPRKDNPALIERIVRYDPLLRVYYDRNVARYGVCRLTRSGVIFIALWQDEVTGAYRPLDSKLLAAIQAWDLRPYRAGAARDADELARRHEAEEERAREKIDQDFDDDIGHATRSNMRQLQRVIAPIY